MAKNGKRKIAMPTYAMKSQMFFQDQLKLIEIDMLNLGGIAG